MSGLRFGLSLSMQGRDGKAWKPSDLFETGSGFLYDFSRADALFQEATGITPAGVDQNVGLALDVSKWGGKTLAQVLAGQAELITNGNFDVDISGWTNVGGSTAIWSSGVMQITADAGFVGGRYQDVTISSGARVEISARCRRLSGTSPLNLVAYVGGAFTTLIGIRQVTEGDFITATLRVSPGGTSIRVYFQAVNGNGVFEVDNVSVKEIPGNHASQATSGARPVLKAGGLTRYDGSDDNLLTTLVPSAAMTLAVKFVNSTAARVAIGRSTTATRNYLGISNLGGTIGGGIGDQNWDNIRSPSGDDRNNLIIGVLTASAADGVRIYRNAVLVYAGALVGTPAGSLPFRIGASNSGSGAAAFLFGDIYKALAIDRALTPAEVLKLTNAWSH